MKRLLSITMIICVLMTATISAYAAQTSTHDIAETGADEIPGLLGDVDNDGLISIYDATCIQRWVSELKILSSDAIARANADMDSETTVNDATHIQRYLGKIKGVYFLNRTITKAKADKEAYLASIEEAKRLKAEQEEQAMLQAEYKLRNEIAAKINNFTHTKGVDISEFNGNVDMQKLKEEGYTFVMIRMGFGANQYSQDDSMFEKNVKKAEAAGLDWGAYLYSYALKVSDIQSEINHTLRLLKGKKPTMPIAFDIEDDDYKYSYGMPSDKTLHDMCLTYLRGIRKAGYYPILYTGCSWLKGALNSKELTGTFDIWLAQWYTMMDYKTDKVGMWQYGGETNYIDSPYIKGLNGMFDKDYCFKNYPVIITAYGLNNHPALITRANTAATSALPYDEEDFMKEDGKKVPEGYNGVMGESLKCHNE